MAYHQKQQCAKCDAPFVARPDAWAKTPSCACSNPSEPPQYRLSPGFLDWLFSRK